MEDRPTPGFIESPGVTHSWLAAARTSFLQLLLALAGGAAV